MIKEINTMRIIFEKWITVRSNNRDNSHPFRSVENCDLYCLKLYPEKRIRINLNVSIFSFISEKEKYALIPFFLICFIRTIWNKLANSIDMIATSNYFSKNFDLKQMIKKNWYEI